MGGSRGMRRESILRIYEILKDNETEKYTLM